MKNDVEGASKAPLGKELSPQVTEVWRRVFMGNVRSLHSSGQHNQQAWRDMVVFSNLAIPNTRQASPATLFPKEGLGSGLPNDNIYKLPIGNIYKAQLFVELFAFRC